MIMAKHTVDLCPLDIGKPFAFKVDSGREYRCMWPLTLRNWSTDGWIYCAKRPHRIISGWTKGRGIDIGETGAQGNSLTSLSLVAPVACTRVPGTYCDRIVLATYWNWAQGGAAGRNAIVCLRMPVSIFIKMQIAKVHSVSHSCHTKVINNRRMQLINYVYHSSYCCIN